MEDQKLISEIKAFLNDIGGYNDYNGKVDAVAEEFGMSKDEAENYVWMCLSGLEDDEDDRYEEIESKSVMDSDGFYTDYTWYKDNLEDRHVFVFGDRDLYRPEDENFDYECDSDEEAEEWFNSYNGFDEDEDDYNEDDMMDESLRSTMTWCNISHPLKEDHQMSFLVSSVDSVNNSINEFAQQHHYDVSIKEMRYGCVVIGHNGTEFNERDREELEQTINKNGVKASVELCDLSHWDSVYYVTMTIVFDKGGSLGFGESLKEAADREIDRKGFKSLIKYGVHDGGGNYAVLNDGYLVRKFWADNDDEAKEIFRRGPSRRPSLTQDDMAAGQWYESLGEAKEEDPKTQSFKKATAAVEKKKEEDKKQNTAQRKKDLVKLEKELKKEKEPKRRAFLQATINKYKKEVKESLTEDALDDVGVSHSTVETLATRQPKQKFRVDVDGRKQVLIGEDLPDYFDLGEKLKIVYVPGRLPHIVDRYEESLKESKEPNEDKWYDSLTKGQKESAMKIALWHKIVAKETSWDKLSAEDKKLVKQAYQKVEKLIKKHIKNESLNEALSGDLYDYDQAVEYIASHGLPTEPDSDLGEYVYELLSEYSEPCYTREILDQIIELAEEVDSDEEYEESLKESTDEDWYSQVHAPKSEVIAWLQDHEQAWKDITSYFKVKSLDYIGLDQIEEWISEHDQLAQDFKNYFGEKSK